MKLYGFPPSPNTRKVQAVAAHLDIPLELEFVNLAKGEARTTEFLLINPGGRTPVLVDGDFTLWESNAIMQYLGSKKKNTLWPADARARADIARWQFWQVAHWHQGCGTFLWENMVKKMLFGMDGDLAARIEMVDPIGADVGEVEAAVRRADGPFCEGETLLDQLALDAGSDNARDAPCLRRDGGCKKCNERCGTEDVHGPVFAGIDL